MCEEFAVHPGAVALLLMTFAVAGAFFSYYRPDLAWKLREWIFRKNNLLLVLAIVVCSSAVSALIKSILCQ